MKITKQLVDRYLKGECTDAEASAIENHLENNPTALDDFFPKAEWHNSPIDKSYEGQDEAYQRLAQKIHPSAKRPMRYLQIAAGIAAVFLIIFAFYRQSYETSLNPSTPALTGTSNELNPSPSSLYYINSGYENMTLTASDGSTITLYPSSEIRYAEDFAPLSERVLHLKGRAKFDVAKDKSKPFRVVSQGIVTTALGTVFIVDEFNVSETRVQLLEGVIEVVSKRKVDAAPIAKTFRPMEEVTIDHRQGQIVQERKINHSTQDRQAYFERHSNSLQFKNLALQDVVDILRQNYGIDLEYSPNSLEDKYYSGTFPESPQVYEHIIKEINYLHDTNITYNKK